jgi:hypothetical protein
MTTNSINQILASLNALDHLQAEKVLNYIKGLIHIPEDDLQYQKMKREALREIRQALRNDEKLNTGH